MKLRYNGKLYTLIDEAGFDQQGRVMAHAMNDDGDMFIIYWTIKDANAEMDSYDFVDWDNPESVSEYHVIRECPYCGEDVDIRAWPNNSVCLNCNAKYYSGNEKWTERK